MKKLDEQSIIRIFQRRLGNKGLVPEDLEVFGLAKSRIAVKTDTLVESTDMPPGMRLADAARKSVVACISDFAAKGIRPRYGVISVNLPKTITRPKIEEVARGFKRACDEYGISIIGGDTNAGTEIVLNVCVFGEAKKMPDRGGAKSRDLIFVTGPFGYTTAGLRMLLGRKGRGGFTAKAVRSVTRPKPRLEFGVKSGRYFSSSMDSSDGLSATLNEMAAQSKKKFIVSSVPAREDLQNYAKTRNLDLNRLVFYGGEEYEIVFTVPPRHRNVIKKNARLFKTPVVEIGYVMPGRGVFICDGNHSVALKDVGWDPFTPPSVASNTNLKILTGMGHET